jgi:hypothetical protein
MKQTELATVHKDDLSLVDENILNANQLKILLKATPKKYVHTRPAKGGGQWEYVTGGYVRKVLNLMFGWNWSFNIVERFTESGEAVVLGRLTCCLPNGHTIVKEQFGNKELICKRGTDQPLSIGNDYKAAATDALKKCAAELGIAADIYNKLDFQALQVVSEDVPKDALEKLNKCSTLDEIDMLLDSYPELKENSSFMSLLAKHQNKIKVNGAA